MEELNEKIKNCAKCGLSKTRTNAVPGAGNPDARIMLVGEAPGYWEDRKGLPFVGRAGKILDELLASAGLSREEVFIANILKCRPPDNRDPKLEEVKACTPYLERQIQLIDPEVIAPLGRFAMEYFLEKYGLEEKKISEVHGKEFGVNTLSGKKRIIPLYHPAVATYDPSKKKVLEEDFKKLVE